MLILIGTVPTAYALNHAVTYKESQDFIAVSQQAAQALDHYVEPGAVIGDARDDLTDFIRTKHFTANTMLAMRTLVNDVGTETSIYKEMKNVPNDRVRNFRNDLYLISEVLRITAKSGQPKFAAADAAILANYKKHVDHSTRFIPTWVKVAVAMALGSGNHGRMEADRGHGRREDRQGSPDLRAGRRGGDHRDGDDRCG